MGCTDYVQHIIIIIVAAEDLSLIILPGPAGGRPESPDGRLVFSHSASEEELFKKTKFAKFFAAKIGAEMDCAMLRERLKIDAEEKLTLRTILY
jgi:hypothetical protein